MSNVKAVDFIVVGAGMAGASAAASLSDMGNVAVLEREEHAGYHSTGRSAAFFSQNYGNPVIRSLTRASRTFIFGPPAGFADVPLCTPRDGLFFARQDQLEQLTSFRADPDVLAATRELSGAEVCSLVPLFRQDYVAGGLLETGSADLDVDAIHQGFLRMARRLGAQIHLNCPVTSLRYENSRWIASTPQGRFVAPVVVNAAGAWADELAALAGVSSVNLEPRRRTALLVPAPQGFEPASWPIAIDISEEFYFKPDAGLLLLSPADEHLSPPCDAQPEELDIAIAVDRFEQATGQQVRQIRRSWAGLRVFSPDRVPVVGFDPIADGFFWLAGQGGYGIQTAPAMGRLAAALAGGLDIPDDIAAQGVSASMLSKSRFVNLRHDG